MFDIDSVDPAVCTITVPDIEAVSIRSVVPSVLCDSASVVSQDPVHSFSTVINVIDIVDQPASVIDTILTQNAVIHPSITIRTIPLAGGVLKPARLQNAFLVKVISPAVDSLPSGQISSVTQLKLL